MQREALRQGISDLGYIDGQTIAVGVRQAEGRNERMPVLAAELIDLKVDVLLAACSPGVLAAKQATTTIPIELSSTRHRAQSGICCATRQR